MGDDVAYILAGGVQTGSGVQRITMRLSRTSDGSVIWAASYDVRAGALPLQGRELATEAAARISDLVRGTQP